MKKILYGLAFLLALSLSWGCSSEPKEKAFSTSLGGDAPFHVRFALSDDLTLRATGNEGQADQVVALAREKKVSSLVAVLFKKGDGAFYKTVPCTAVAGQSNVYEFDAMRKVDLFFYLVANPSPALLEDLEHHVRTKEELANLVATQTPGENSTSDNFLMVSDRHTVSTISSTTVTLPTSPVMLTRLAVRYDFYNAIEELEITKITFENRYTESHLYAQVGKMNALTSESTKVYATQLKGSDNAADDASKLLASVYSYENDIQGTTAFTIEGTYKGKAIKPQKITFDGMTIKRNFIYELHLNAIKDGPITEPDRIIEFKIKVQDWSIGERVDKTIDTPLNKTNWVGYSAELPYASYMTSSLKENPTPLRTLTNDAVTIKLAVHTYEKPGIIDYEPGQQKGASVLKEIPGAVSQDPVTGRYTKWYEFSVPAKPDREAKIEVNDESISGPDVLGGHAPMHERKRRITYTMWNLVAKTADGSHTCPLPVAHGRLRMILENVAEYDLAPIPGINFPGPKDDYYKGAAPVDYRAALGNVNYSDPSIYRFASSHNTSDIGYFPMNEELIKTLHKGVVIDGKKYHMAENQFELTGIIPSTGATMRRDISPIGKNAPARFEMEESLNLPPVFYVDRKSVYQTWDISTSSVFRTPPSKNGRITYAVRFRELRGNGIWQFYDEALVTAYRYEWVGSLADNSTDSKLVVTCRLLGENWIEHIDGTVATEAFWQKDKNMDVTRVFPLSGCFVGKEEFPWAYGSVEKRKSSNTYEGLGFALRYPAKNFHNYEQIYAYVDSANLNVDGYKVIDYYLQGTRLDWYLGARHTIFPGPIVLKPSQQSLSDEIRRRQAMYNACHGRLYPLRLFRSE